MAVDAYRAWYRGYWDGEGVNVKALMLRLRFQKRRTEICSGTMWLREMFDEFGQYRFGYEGMSVWSLPGRSV